MRVYRLNVYLEDCIDAFNAKIIMLRDLSKDE